MRGREFTRLDIPSSQPVAIVSRSLAKTYWPGEDALDKSISITDQQWRRIVGIVEDVRYDGQDTPVRPTIYIPFAQFPRPMIALHVRTDTDPASFSGAIRRAVMAVDQQQPLFGMQTMEQALNESVSLKRFLMLLMGIFAGVAVLLGTVGVYGVLAYFVGQRRQEIGIRIALGASRSDVVWTIVRQAALLALAGVGIGLLGSLALSSTLSSLLFGVSATDPWTFAIVPTLLFVAVLLAAFLPARTAASVEPTVALRGD